MKPGIPWSVKGIDQQARAAAKQAARQSGMTIGEWLNSVILDSAEDGDDLERRFRRGPYRPKAAPHGAEGEGEGDDVNLRLEELAEQLHALTSQQSDTAVSRLSAAAGAEHDQGIVQAILQRLDSYEQHTSSALGAMQERLEEVSDRLSRLPDGALPQSPADVPGLPALEGAMRNIIEHIEVSETRTRDAVKTLQDRFERMEAYDSAGPGAAVIARLEQNVAELSQRLAGSGAEPNQHVNDDIAKLRAEIESLNQRFDDLKADAASDRDVLALRATVDGLAASGKTGGTAGLERQIAGLAERLTASEQRLDHMATIERSVEQLVKSLDETRASTAEVAEVAAKRAAEQVLAGRGSPGVRSPELEALENGLKAIRANAEISDRRTQETFAAVHETLEQIVAKLAEIEAGEGQPEDDTGEDETDQVETAQADVADDVDSDETASDETKSLYDTETPEPDASLADEDQARSPEADGETDEPDSAADPYLYAASSAYGMDTPDEPARQASEAGETPVREDYIAAARRAAQMAATRNSGFNLFSQRMSGSTPEVSSPAAGKGEKKRKFSVLGRLRPSRGGADGKSAEAAASSKRKRLILAGLVLLVAASAYGASRHAGLVSSTDALWPRVGFGQPPAPVATASEAQSERQSEVQPSDTQSEHRSDAQPVEEPTATAAISTLAMPQAETALAPPDIGPDSLRQAAAQGDATAQFIVASRYLEGGDQQQAAQWFKRAAMQGHAPSQYRLGTLYERGRGVALDRDAARLWYEEAAGRGNIRAMHNLAVLHADPKTDLTNIELAADWFRKAAERGLKDSQFNLAVLSAQGAGVPESGEEALFWFSLSAAQGDQEAAVRVRSLESSLPGEATVRVKERLVGWVPLPADETANAVKVADPSWYAVSAPEAQAEAADEPVSDTALSDTALIRRAQELLSQRGYDIGDEDGVMGDRTANAVRLFQLKSRLPVNGMVSHDLVRALESRQL